MGHYPQRYVSIGSETNIFSGFATRGTPGSALHYFVKIVSGWRVSLTQTRRSAILSYVAKHGFCIRRPWLFVHRGLPFRVFIEINLIVPGDLLE